MVAKITWFFNQLLIICIGLGPGTCQVVAAPGGRPRASSKAPTHVPWSQSVAEGPVFF
jgi:hypothetical protein